MVRSKKNSSLNKPKPENIEELRAKLEEAEQTLAAIRSGQVDALVVSGTKGDQIFTLSDANHIYRIIVETMNESALTVDFDGTILFCNQQFADLMRVSMEKVRGEKVTRFTADPQASVLLHLLQQAQSAPVRHRILLKAYDGEAIHVLLAASPLPIEGMKSICLVLTDLTELETWVKSIAILRKQQQELEQKEHVLRLKTEELARSNYDLEQFAYIASHDLQEPLRSVVSFSQLLQDRAQKILDPKCTKYLDFIRNGATRMSSMINDLLTYSRVGADDSRQEPTSCPMALNMAKTFLEILIAETGTKITESDLPVVSVRRTHLVQLFQNLIGNAIKFRREDVPPEINISAKREGNMWLLSVKDNGIGIEPEYHDKIFLIFGRLHSRDQYSGTGIGLAVCKRIVEKYGGRIWVESEPGKGTTFFFTLPQAPEGA